jgi:hypothetical protein
MNLDKNGIPYIDAYLIVYVQLIQEMELSVARRETISTKAKIAAKTNKSNNTQASIQKEVSRRNYPASSICLYHVYALGTRVMY